MVVAGREIDDTVVELVARVVENALLVAMVLVVYLIVGRLHVGDGFAFVVQDRSRTRRSVLGPVLLAEEGPQRVVDALHLFQVALAHFAEMQNLPITRTYLEEKEKKINGMNPS